MKEFDSVVIGAGPAGVTAALYLARFGLSVALIEQLAPGGLLLQTSDIENYPGFPKGIQGYELADAFTEHLVSYDSITRLSDAVVAVDLAGPLKRLKVGDEWIQAKSVIVCSGVVYRKIGLPEEEHLLGKGISHCALCDGNFFRGQNIAVVGGGNSAVDEALYLSKIVDHIHLIHRRDEFRASPIALKRLEQTPNITIERSSIVTQIHGKDAVDGITVKRLKTGKEEHLPVNGVFVFIGFTPNVSYLGDVLHKDSEGFIETDSEMRTNIPGVFAAGDIRSKLCRQIVTAVGDGATAANSAFTYLEQ